MSYDLFFDFPSTVQADELERYFSTRPNYQLANGAFYQNQATGVYFQFAWSADPHRNQVVSKVSFNMNYFRPHVFAARSGARSSFVCWSLHAAGSGPAEGRDG